MNEQEFLNAYIENMSNKISELTKNEIIHLTQIQILQKTISNLSTELDTVLKREIAEPKKNIKKIKEVDTPDSF